MILIALCPFSLVRHYHVLNLCATRCGRVMEEFFRQGDKEKELGLPVGGLHDRDTTNIPKSQMGFIDFIVLPLWETWDTLVGGGALLKGVVSC